MIVHENKKNYGEISNYFFKKKGFFLRVSFRIRTRSVNGAQEEHLVPFDLIRFRCCAGKKIHPFQISK